MLKNLFAIALLLTAGVAIAAEGAAPAKVDVSVADANKDGVISKEEAAAVTDEAVKAAIVALDADKDGSVSAAEMKAH